mgnify:CR=1 FL=1|jgi:hypothetical protein
MVCDEENQTYEPYTGGKPSPSPEYPQEIVSVGGNGSIGVEITGKNLFDLSKEYTSISVVNTFTFTLKPSTKYTLSTDFPATVNVASIYFGGPSSNINGVWKGVFDGSEDEEWKKGGINYIHIECLPVAMSDREGFCSQYIVGNNICGIRIGNGNVSLIIFDDFSDENALSNFKANLSANPLKVMTYLDTPIETDITQEEIKDYQSLVTYDGTTIVENDAECYTKITYMAKGN